MRFWKVALGVFVALVVVIGPAGCTRAVRDGVSIGVTEGLSDGLAQLISEFVISLSDDDE